jgi:hypothetical protein
VATFGVAYRVVHGDVTTAGVQVQPAGLVELDVAGRGFEPALSEAALAVQVRHGRAAVHVRARRKFDCHIDRPHLAEEAAQPWCLHQQFAACVLNAGLFRGLYVGLVDPSLGRTSTTVSVRSLAVIRT